MLREIKLSEVGNYAEEDILIIYDEGVYTMEEFRDIARYLVDENETSSERDPDPETPAPTRKRRSQEEIREMIRDAVEAGCKSASAIAKHTGLTYDTVKRNMERS